MSKDSKIIIGPYRCMWPTLGTPKSFTPGDESSAKYGVKLLIPKSDKVGVKKILTFVEQAVKATAWNATVKAQVLKTAKDQDPYNDNAIIKDGDKLNARRVDEEKAPYGGYEGHYIISLNRHSRIGAPAVVDANNDPIPAGLVDAAIVGGYYVKVQIGSYCYDKPKQGVTCQLGAVQKVREGEAFTAPSPFAAVPEAEQDADPFGTE